MLICHQRTSEPPSPPRGRPGPRRMTQPCPSQNPRLWPPRVCSPGQPTRASGAGRLVSEPQGNRGFVCPLGPEPCRAAAKGLQKPRPASVGPGRTRAALATAPWRAWGCLKVRQPGKLAIAPFRPRLAWPACAFAPPGTMVAKRSESLGGSYVVGVGTLLERSGKMDF